MRSQAIMLSNGDSSPNITGIAPAAYHKRNDLTILSKAVFHFQLLLYLETSVLLIVEPFFTLSYKSAIFCRVGTSFLWPLIESRQDRLPYV